MAKFTLTIDTDNAAFADGALGYEVARILDTLAQQIESETAGRSTVITLRDSNGNTVGKAELTA